MEKYLVNLVVPVLVELAEHSSFREFADEVTNLIEKLDQDGAFDDTADAVEGRRATVVEVAGMLGRCETPKRWRTRRDRRGRAYTIRDDGTIIPGERPPDLSIDEYTELARTRLRALRPTG